MLLPRSVGAGTLAPGERYAVIDLETNGGRPAAGNIVEVAIVNFDGEAEVSRFSSLLHPETPLSDRVVWPLAITNSMLATAPSFFQLARQIVELTEGRTLVGHNVAFDYGFLKAAFHEIGYAFRRSTICTMRLARQLMPECESYKLSALNERLHLGGQSFHRALDDALVTARLFFTLRRHGPFPLAKRSNLAPLLTEAMLAAVPDAPGVYRLEDAQRRILYIGKSKAMRTRIKQHLYYSRAHDSQKTVLFGQVAHLAWVPTGSELLAELEELHLIKEERPRFNRLGKIRQFKYALYVDPVHRNFVIKCSTRVSAAAGLHLLGRYGSRRSAERDAARWASHYAKAVGFSENSLDHLLAAADRRATYPQPNSLIELPGRNAAEQAFIVVRAGTYRGYFFATREGSCLLHAPRHEYVDVKALLIRRWAHLPTCATMAGSCCPCGTL